MTRQEVVDRLRLSQHRERAEADQRAAAEEERERQQRERADAIDTAARRWVFEVADAGDLAALEEDWPSMHYTRDLLRQAMASVGLPDAYSGDGTCRYLFALAAMMAWLDLRQDVTGIRERADVERLAY